MTNTQPGASGQTEKFKRVPQHIGVIPDGNRRWALDHELAKHEGYAHGISPGMRLVDLCAQYGVKEVTFYAFTVDNTKRAAPQIQAYTDACIEAVKAAAERGYNVMAVGNENSKFFPPELKDYANKRVCFGDGKLNLNFLVNYSWKWDLLHIDGSGASAGNIENAIASREVSRIDLLLRWGGRQRLSGFLPVQSVYADFFVIDEYWPDYKDEHFFDALRWYQDCDVTLGG
ncbi:MAG: undecaprenyl diphosphate synthase family protein [Defluviitaleaceae bacterium]|nr:undecaprenyl diphosphate synthase family protein [Defluviitaleaceae bacterium]